MGRREGVGSVDRGLEGVVWKGMDAKALGFGFG